MRPCKHGHIRSVMEQTHSERSSQQGRASTISGEVCCISVEMFYRSLCKLLSLNLFSGTGTVGKDKLHIARSDLIVHVEVVWAPLLCTQFSIPRTRAKTPRGIVYADRLVSKARPIVSWYPGVCFFIEHPLGFLKDRPVVQGRPRNTVDDCEYKDDHRPQLYRTK